MEQPLNKLLKDIKDYPEGDLKEQVWSLVIHREKQEYLIKSWSYGILGVLSLFGLVISIKDLMLKFSQSGFYEYLSLAFSESGSVATYWREFALSLADSLPITSIVLSLLAVFILFISIRRTLKQFKNQLSLA